VPDWLRFALPLETPAQQRCCQRHDTAYEAGGARVARLRADLTFALGLLRAGMAPDRVEQYLWGVRQYGGAHWAGGDAPGAQPLHPPPPSQVEAP